MVFMQFSDQNASRNHTPPLGLIDNMCGDLLGVISLLPSEPWQFTQSASISSVPSCFPNANANAVGRQAIKVIFKHKKT